MIATDIYKKLNDEFEIDKLNEDEWSFFDLGDAVTESFRKTRKGLVLDNSTEINKVYTAVFPSEPVLDYIIASGAEDTLLFTHHPMIWDPSSGGFPFRNIPAKYLEVLEEKNISLYTIHVPLDRNGPYSTTVSLARALEIKTEREFFDYHGVMVGIIGKTECTSNFELAAKIKETVGHLLKTWVYGSMQITNGNVALVAGGGNYPEIVEELAETDIKTYITGVTMKNPDYEPSMRFHEICQEHSINVIAATHYSTEKFACIAVQKFFEELGVPSEFLEDDPSFEDYG
ncbi:MAG: Nif3-like dinuclear metal center hexameric protein [Candidatus Thorarchaeota archaeon]|nr:Nif3-like dinuclear metal center hexameric protein [Candidatus Thorarchaeota archaeon]